MTIQIDFANKNDMPHLVELLAELFALEADFAPDPAKQLRGLLTILDEPELGKLFVARTDGKVVGMANALITISTANETASAGLRTHCHQPAGGRAISSRRRAWSRTSKYGEGSGTCHSSSSAMVRRNSFSLPAQPTQLCRCSFTSGVTASKPAARSGISSLISLHFITKSFIQTLSVARAMFHTPGTTAT
jgi:hypothetical protein